MIITFTAIQELTGDSEPLSVEVEDITQVADGGSLPDGWPCAQVWVGPVAYIVLGEPETILRAIWEDGYRQGLADRSAPIMAPVAAPIPQSPAG